VVPVLNRELEVRIRMAKANASAKSLKDNALRMQVSNDAGGLKFLGMQYLPACLDGCMRL
jgi:hypothetical protein